MAILRLIKRRIKTTQSIAQITRAMEMVAALKMRRAQEQALRSRPYTEKASQILSNLVRSVSASTHPLFFSPKNGGTSQGKRALLLMTPNRGLCGSLITNLFREVSSFVTQGKEITYLSYGKRGRDFLVGRALAVLADFEFVEPPRFEKAVDILRVLTDGFLAGDFAEVYLAYTHFESTMRQRPVILPLLPLKMESPEAKEKSAFNWEYLFEPQAKLLLEIFVPHFLETKVYQAILEAYASEQSARMMAMRGATENAQEIMAELTLSYNKERQQVITGEISDIVTAQLGLATA